MNSIERNRELIKRAGGREAVGRLFDCSGQAVGLWYANGVPAERVIKLCEAVEYRVKPHELRPDLYPHPEDGLPAEMRAVRSDFTQKAA